MTGTPQHSAKDPRLKGIYVPAPHGMLASLMTLLQRHRLQNCESPVKEWSLKDRLRTSLLNLP